MKIVEIIGLIIRLAAAMYLIYLVSKTQKDLKEENNKAAYTNDQIKYLKNDIKENRDLIEKLIEDMGKKIEKKRLFHGPFPTGQFIPEIVNLTEEEKKINELKQQIKELERENH